MPRTKLSLASKVTAPTIPKTAEICKTHRHCIEYSVIPVIRRLPKARGQYLPDGLTGKKSRIPLWDVNVIST